MMQIKNVVNLSRYYQKYLPKLAVDVSFIQNCLKTLIKPDDFNTALSNLNEMRIQAQNWQKIISNLNKLNVKSEFPDVNQLTLIGNQCLNFFPTQLPTKKSFSEIMLQFLLTKEQGIEKLQQNTLMNNFKTQTFTQFNHYFDDIKDGKLITYSALTGFGKTTFALNLMLQFSDAYYQTHQKYPIIQFLSYEMTHLELLERIVAIKTQVNLTTIKRDSFKLDNHYTLNGVETKPYSQAFEDYLEKIKQIPQYKIEIDSFPNFNDITTLENNARLASLNGELDMLFIDYLNLIQNHEFFQNPERAIDNIISRLKKLSIELKIPIFLITQFTKDASKNTKDADFNVVDMKGSSSIAQYSDIVFYLQHAHFKDADIESYYSNFNVVKLIITKNRSGKLGQIYFDFQKPIQTFREIPPFKSNK